MNQLALIKKQNEFRNADFFVDEINLANISEKPWQFGFDEENRLLSKMSSIRPVLSDVCDKIFQGIITGADKVFVLELESDIDQEVVQLHSKALGKSVKIERKILKPLLKGSLDIRRYKIVSPTKYAIFPYQINGLVAKLIPFNELSAMFPNCSNYLKSNRKTLEEREHGTWKCSEWYSYSRNQNLVQCGKRKILTPSIAKKAAFVYDEQGFYYFLGSGGGGGGGYGLSLNEKFNLSPFYLIGLLNSKLLDYLTKKVSTHFSGGFFAYNKQYIQSLPIVVPKGTRENALSNQIADLAIKITGLNRAASATSDSTHIELLKREATVYEERIDELVYELYVLTDEEKHVVGRV